MSPFDELSNNDNTSAADDIVSESSGFKTSPADDLFDIIEPSEPVEEKNEDSGFVQDEDFLNSLDFINGFSDIDENATEAVEDTGTDIQADEDLDLNGILNEAAPDVTEGMIADIPDTNDGMISDIPNVPNDVITDIPDMNTDIPGMSTNAPDMGMDIPDMNTDIPGMSTNVPDMGMDIPNMSMDVPEVQDIAETALSGISDINADTVTENPGITDVPVDMPAEYNITAETPSEIPVDAYATDIPAEEMIADYTAASGVQQEAESTGDAYNGGENEEESDEDYYDDTEEEPMMIVTEGTTITGSIGTNTSMLILGSVNGDITCEGKLTISGKVIGNSFAMDVFVNSPRVEGNIGCTGTLKISQGTVVIGDISAGAAAIAGAVKGNLDITGPVILDSTAVIKGNIKAKSVQLINGAVLEGFCTLEYSDSQLDEIFANDAG